MSDPGDGPDVTEYASNLSKWTNYLLGWQTRYFSLSCNGTLAYYKSETEKEFGCRGAISVRKANIRLHEFDECRFDISVGDSVWYLRCERVEERNRWIEALEQNKQFIDSAYGSENSLRRHGSALSLGSLSQSSLKKRSHLKEKVAEIETYSGLLARQLEDMQRYLDGVAAAAGTTAIESKTGFVGENELAGDSTAEAGATSDPEPFDFRAQVLTFKATASGILGSVSHCVDLIQQRDELWRKRLDEEAEKRKKLEEALSKQRPSEHGNGQAGDSAEKLRLLDGPDFEEGPHSKIKEDEFFDAIDAMLDKHDQQQEEKRQLKLRAKEIGEPSTTLPEKCDHPLWPEIDKITSDQLYYARLEPEVEGQDDSSGGSGWQLFAEEGEMRLYKRELEVDGLVCDPLKAVHTVKGVTGHEMCFHFFSPDVRWDWENTLESMKVIEELNPNTLVFHQIHKRVWPAAQRDAVFWSHIRRAPSADESEDLQDIWVVCNNSTEHDVPLGRCVRMKMTVSLTCETYIKKPADGRPVTRDDITCKIIYCSTINPGGWAPASVLRALYKREYPKFLKRFTQYVIDAQEKKPILF